MTMRKYSLFVFCFIVTMQLLAVPAERIRKRLTMADGSQVMGTLMGNENHSYYILDDGTVAEKNERGFMRTYLTPEDYSFLRDEPTRRMPLTLGLRETAAISGIGVKHVPVVLVAFSDKPFSVCPTDAEVNDYYQKYCNGTMDGQVYTEHGSHGSIRDYFVEQSDSAFLPEFTVIGPVTLEKEYAFYGKNSSYSSDVNFNFFRNEAIAKAFEAFGEDWSLFDNNGDGDVDMVFFVYAGLGENSSDDEDAIWPKESSSSFTIDGIRFTTSAATCECRPNEKDENGHAISTKGDGVGVFIHEFSHTLGLPDFYDTNNVAFGMDIWSVMDYGEYGNAGYNPGNYTAYERDFMGWRPLETISGPATLRINPFAENGIGYKIVNDDNPDEYYIIENRQPVGWDDAVGVFGHGLQVTHVDYAQTRWTSNRVNTDATHQRMTIIAANNNYRGTNAAADVQEWKACLAGNLYPGDTFNYDLTATSVPANEVFSGGYMGKDICDISEESDGTITLKVAPLGTLNAPEDIEVYGVGTNGFSVRWENVVNAECYRVMLYQEDELVYMADSLKCTEYDFDNLTDDSNYRVSIRAMSDSYLNSSYASVEVRTDYDAIPLVPESECLVRVFSLDGSYICQCYADEIKRLRLHKGVYVVRPMKGRVRKVLIK